MQYVANALVYSAKNDQESLKRIFDMSKKLMMQMARKCPQINRNLDEIVVDMQFVAWNVTKHFDASRNTSFNTVLISSLKNYIATEWRKSYAQLNGLGKDIRWDIFTMFESDDDEYQSNKYLNYFKAPNIYDGIIFDDYVKVICTRLNGIVLSVFKEKISPSREVFKIAEDEAVERGSKAKHRHSKVRVLNRHIADYLHITREYVQIIINKKIMPVIKEVLYEGRGTKYKVLE